MDTKRICIKAISILVMIAALSCSWGRETLKSAVAENQKCKDDILCRCIINGGYSRNSTVAKIHALMVSPVKSRDYRAFSLLCKSIKYKQSDSGCYVYVYNANQILIYDKLLGECVYFRYDCKPKKARYGEDYCLAKAKEAFCSVYSGSDGAIGYRFECFSKKETAYGFYVYDSEDGRVLVRIDVRRDSGSIILFDALVSRKERDSTE